MKAWALVAYAYRADLFCPGCIVGQLTTNPGDVGHGRHRREAVTPEEVEAHLDLLARIKGVDREDEYSFDSDDFPKPVLADQIREDEVCGTCGGLFV